MKNVIESLIQLAKDYSNFSRSTHGWCCRDYDTDAGNVDCYFSRSGPDHISIKFSRGYPNQITIAFHSHEEIRFGNHENIDVNYLEEFVNSFAKALEILKAEHAKIDDAERVEELRQEREALQRRLRELETI